MDLQDPSRCNIWIYCQHPW